MPRAGLRNKMKEHNAKSKYKVTMRMLEQVYDRGVGAYRTNPSSVRPNVKSPEQWAMARVNSFLRIVSGSKSANHDKDLLPANHPSSTKKSLEETLKRRMDDDVFTTPAEAHSRSMMMGFNGDIHTHEVGTTVYYMPGKTHDDYLDYHRGLAGIKETPQEEQKPLLARVLTAVIDEISKVERLNEDAVYVDKADKPLNKPFRLPAGSSKKFGVYVKSGDRTVKVTFGDPNMEIRRDDPKARANFRSRHSCDTASDKTTARYWSCRMWEKGTSVTDLTKMDIEGKILKADDEQRIVYGWASVITEKGERVVDRQGDVIEADTLVKAVNDFMENVRVGKTMHTGEQTGMVIHSLPITKEIGESLGIQSDREGWVVAYKVYDDGVWNMVKSGELAAFSIGGRAIKEKLNEPS
jgi:uncharacterized protein YndB with AHSA1/START domain